MSEEFDPTPYLRPPSIDVQAGLSLSVALLRAMPKPPNEGVRKAAVKLRAAAVELQDAWKRGTSTATPGEKRMADIAIDNAWSALHARLDAYASLPQTHWPKAARAAELIAILFPDGLAFITLPYAEEWAEGDKRLGLIDERGLGTDIDALAGSEFLAEVRRAQARYADVLNVHKPVGGAGGDLTDPLRALGRAIATYALQVVAMSDGSPSSIRIVRQVLKPIDDLRAVASRRGSEIAGVSEAVTLISAVPDVEA